jgi:NAD/NADP transhydrogenase beta subunit
MGTCRQSMGLGRLSGSGRVFILALRGLSSPASAQSGNRFGMAGMTIAVVTTLLTHRRP